MRITLTKKRAVIKLRVARSAVYYIQFGKDGQRYTRPVPIDELVSIFRGDRRAKLRIDTETSKHTVTLVEKPDEMVGYEVEF